MYVCIFFSVFFPSVFFISRFSGLGISLVVFIPGCFYSSSSVQMANIEVSIMQWKTMKTWLYKKLWASNVHSILASAELTAFYALSKKKPTPHFIQKSYWILNNTQSAQRWTVFYEQGLGYRCCYWCWHNYLLSQPLSRKKMHTLKDHNNTYRLPWLFN